ncbi:Dmp6 [Thalictrum thalictroides]|uniref:Dmp6 n=1 Tax=Thalictrum thalictroides TaxID=46969 RepID=A0A7J6USV7_THATH|nr:Dmp6 [Thalictrum thalictroides]
MEINVANEESNHPHREQQQPLLRKRQIEDVEQQTLIQKAITQTFQSTAHLANLLPTGTVLAFQLLAPIFSNQGHCDTVSRFMTAILVALCGVSCFILCFTDSFRDGNGKVCYGLATIRGLWVIDGSATVSPELAQGFCLKFIDFLHAFMSILVFAAVALFDQNVVNCFYPAPSEETKELLTTLPVGIGVICSMLFIIFPTNRHGIGFPLSAQ